MAERCGSDFSTTALKTDASGRTFFLHPMSSTLRSRATPKTFTLFNRDGDPYTEIGGNNVHFVPGSSGLKIQDHRTGETRLSNSNDFIEYARLCDGLEHIAYLATAFSTNKDIESQVSDAWRLYMTLTTSKKPVVSGAFSEEGVPRMAGMMEMFRDDRAIWSRNRCRFLRSRRLATFAMAKIPVRTCWIAPRPVFPLKSCP